MPSQALSTLKVRLHEVDEVVQARDAICPTGAGRPARRRGAAVVRAGTVLLAALFEGYVEDVFDDAVDLLYSSGTDDKRKSLKENTSGKLNNAGPYKVNMLFFNLGIPWIMASNQVRWQGFNNAAVEKALQDLITARNRIAHGSSFSVRKISLVAWRSQIERLAEPTRRCDSSRIFRPVRVLGPGD